MFIHSDAADAVDAADAANTVCIYVCMYTYIHTYIHIYYVYSVCIHLSLSLFTAHKLTLTPRRKNFQSANVWGPGDFGSRFQ